MNKLDVLSYLSPQMLAVLAKEDELAGDANDTGVGFEKMRENYVLGREYWTQGGPEPIRRSDERIDGPYGPISVRYYYPTDASVAALGEGKPETPVIVYAHGGGFVLGNLDTHDRIVRILAQKTGAVIVAVDYRLSPEYKYPSAVEEVAHVAEYLHEHGAEHGIDGDRISFAGDSGGAHLGVAATLFLRDRLGDCSFVKCLLLFYGWFGLRDSMSMRLLGGPWDGLTEKDWGFYMSLYAREETDLAEEPYANLFLNDMSTGMPACYIAAAEFDPLLDDSATLAAICGEYGIPFRFEIFEGVIHAFLHYTRMLDAANDALEHGATFFREQLGLPALIEH